MEVNIAIMRAFVRLRQMLATHKDLTAKLEEMEKTYDGQFRLVFDAIRQLMSPPAFSSLRRSMLGVRCSMFVSLSSPNDPISNLQSPFFEHRIPIAKS